MKHLLGLVFISLFCILNTNLIEDTKTENQILAILCFLLFAIIVQIFDLKKLPIKLALSKSLAFFFVVLEILLSMYLPSIVFGIPLLLIVFYKKEDLPYSIIALTTLLLSIPLLAKLALILNCGLALWISYELHYSQELLDAQTRALDTETGERFKLLQERELLIEKHLVERESEKLRERNRIAREIHDRTGHKLSASILQVHALRLQREMEESYLQKNNVATTTTIPMLEGLEETLQTAMQEIRDSVHNIYQSSLSIQSAIETQVSEYLFCPVYWSVKLTEEPSIVVHRCILSIITEALTNTAKHSDANRVNISLTETSEDYFLIIEDNGIKKGLDDKQVTGGIGLIGIENRVRELNGVLHITQESGFRIFVRLPKQAKSYKK